MTHLLLDRENVLTCAKQYVGDGGIIYGIDEYNTVIGTTHARLLQLNQQRVWQPLWPLTPGIVTSDFKGLDRMTSPPRSNFTYSVEAGVSAGIDMFMVPKQYTKFIDDLTMLLKNKFIPMSRIDDAVRRILGFKFMMGFFEKPFADYSLVGHLGIQVSYFVFQAYFL
ncbi:hypothetical protein RJT34_12425 [Clitoria ternatea]|uniref:Glycoside hydrolase family 3 N-terminal domain-containing protein n=1 Tax=Clitoria ternatea TaxID=43366 RepID=A0AAN9JPF2_CLITE